MRAIVCRDNDRYDGAFRDLDAALRLDPRYVPALLERSFLWAARNRMDLALEEVNRAVSIDPRSADARLDPNDVEAHISRSWTLATCPEAKLRDGKTAVTSATRACELTQWKSPRPLVTLAAAFAEAGDFDGAVQMQTKAIEITPVGDPVRRYYESSLERYQARKPWHRLGLLEEWGLKRYHPPAAPDKRDPEVNKAGAFKEK